MWQANSSGTFRSVEHVCEVSSFSGPHAAVDAPYDILLELPHGATLLQHLQQAKSMAREYPGDDHDLFFLANTDQGSPEYAQALAEMLTRPDSGLDWGGESACSLKILMIRALIPRTILDVNRVWSSAEEALAAGLTRGVPDFITHEEDLAACHEAFRSYHEVVGRAYDAVCGAGGFAFQLHTYAPLSVNPVEGEYIVDTLRSAYAPENEGMWPKRPQVQLITTPPGGSMLSHGGLCDRLQAAYGEIGIETARDNPFNLHPATMAHTYAQRYPGQVLTLEISRALLAETFNPFTEMVISHREAQRLASPIAKAFLSTPGLRRQ